MSLEDEVNDLIRNAAASTSIGMAAWVHGREGIREEATDREGGSELDALTRSLDQTRELVLALISGHHDAIALLAREIDALRSAQG
jgi:hypothetical protein